MNYLGNVSLEEAQVTPPNKYIVTFIFTDGTTLVLPYANEETVKTVMGSLIGKTGVITIFSAEPVPSSINMDLFVCATPSLNKPEG